MLSPFHSKFWILMDFLHSSAEVLGALVCLSSVCILQPTAASCQADKKHYVESCSYTQKRKSFQGSWNV